MSQGFIGGYFCHFHFPDKNVMYEIIGRVLEKRKKNPPSDGERLFVDELLDMDFSEDVRCADMVTVFITALHATGLCRIFDHKLYIIAVFFFLHSVDVMQDLLLIKGTRTPRPHRR